MVLLTQSFRNIVTSSRHLHCRLNQGEHFEIKIVFFLSHILVNLSSSVLLEYKVFLSILNRNFSHPGSFYNLRFELTGQLLGDGRYWALWALH